jgi:hypothetical protein
MSTKSITAAAIAAMALLFYLNALADDIPSQLSADVAAAERDGRILFDTSSHPAAPEDPVVAAARAKISDFCQISYKAVVVPSQPVPIVYFLGAVPPKDGMVFGRHYKVTGENVSISTKGCVVVPPGPNNSVAAYITHLLSPAPTEFHVYLSLALGRPIFVGTSQGVWSVRDGKIAFVKKRSGG